MRSARSDVPPELEAVYQKMVARYPRDRFQSMAQLIVALEDFSAGPPRDPTRGYGDLRCAEVLPPTDQTATTTAASLRPTSWTSRFCGSSPPTSTTNPSNANRESFRAARQKKLENPAGRAVDCLGGHRWILIRAASRRSLTDHHYPIPLPSHSPALSFPCPLIPLPLIPLPSDSPALSFPCPLPCPLIPLPPIPLPPIPLPSHSLALSFPCPLIPLPLHSLAPSFPGKVLAF